MTDKEFVEQVVDFRNRLVNEIEFLYSISENAPDKSHLGGQVQAYDTVVNFIDDLKEK